MLKVIIIILFIFVLLSIFGGAVFLIKDKGNVKSKRTYYALMCRVISVVLLISTISYGLWTGELNLKAPWHAAQHQMTNTPSEAVAPETPNSH